MSSLKNNLKRVEKGYITDIENVLKDLTQNYHIVTHKGKHMTYTELINIYIPNDDEKIYQCTAVLNNGNRCSYKSLKGTDFLYCKKHIFKYNKHKITQKLQTCIEENEEFEQKFNDMNLKYEQENQKEHESERDPESEYESESESSESEETVCMDSMKKQFINDKLYYHDNKFIYYNNKKCGYIDNNEFILIDDPFLLNQL